MDNHRFEAPLYGDCGKLIEVAERQFCQALEACDRLRHSYPMHYPEHIAGMALVKLWALHIEKGRPEDLRRAYECWTQLRDELPRFVEDELPFFEDFWAYAGRFAFDGGLPRHDLEGVDALLRRALPTLRDKDSRCRVTNSIEKLNDALSIA